MEGISSFSSSSVAPDSNKLASDFRQAVAHATGKIGTTFSKISTKAPNDVNLNDRGQWMKGDKKASSLEVAEIINGLANRISSEHMGIHAGLKAAGFSKASTKEEVATDKKAFEALESKFKEVVKERKSTFSFRLKNILAKSGFGTNKEGDRLGSLERQMNEKKAILQGIKA